MNYAVEVQDLSKHFRLYHEKYSSLKERVLHAGNLPYDDFWALQDVSVAIEAGKTVGILGRNGSGKSTLLKCIAGILQPSSGQVIVRGQLAAMLELGAGMQPELSGRENIYLNGSLLGLSRKEISRRFDDIVAFAELEQFIDNQVRYYSSGMYVRLGFAVAVNVDPDVLLVDEVLAVGDERFQQKCLDKVSEFQEEGRTIIVVSHAPDMLRQICEEIIVIDHGKILTVAPPGEAIRIFRDSLIATDEVHTEPETVDGVSSMPRRQVEITEVGLEFPGAGERTYLVTGDPLRVRARLVVHQAVRGARFELTLLNERNEVIFGSQGDALAGGDVLDPGETYVSFVFDTVPLLDGRFTVNVYVRDAHSKMLANAEPAATFEVMNPGRSVGMFSLAMRTELSDQPIASSN
ncbi:MAG TPA: ABC transporter ATP-binding protein [Acidimicrobiales bacterium]|nr:ABC transporter ATP-binding protein [Acidimicrobiales bacterium]